MKLGFGKHQINFKCNGDWLISHYEEEAIEACNMESWGQKDD